MNEKLLASLIRSWADRLGRETYLLSDAIEHKSVESLRAELNDGALAVAVGLDDLQEQMYAAADLLIGANDA